jgi:hypothetical protein
MANREKGEIRMVVDGKEYTLVLNTGVMATLEDHFSTPQKDVTWDEIWGRVLRGSVKTVRALIWAMLQPHHPTLTIAAVSILIDQAGGFEGLTDILKQAGQSSAPDPADVKELGVPKGPRAAQGTRSRRGTGGASTSTRAASV